MNSKFPFGSRTYSSGTIYKSEFSGRISYGWGSISDVASGNYMYYNNLTNMHIVPYQWEETTTTAFSSFYNNSGEQKNNVFNLSKTLWTFIDGQGYNSGLWDPVGFSYPNGFQEFENIWLGAETIGKLEELNIDAFSTFSHHPGIIEASPRVIRRHLA